MTTRIWEYCPDRKEGRA